MTRRPRHLVAVLALGIAGTALADLPVRMTGRDLGVKRVALVELDETSAVVRGSDHRPARVALDALLAVAADHAVPPTLPHPGPGAPSGLVFVELVDGQRLAVEIEAGDADDALACVAVGFGPARLPLERVARVVRPGGGWHAPTPAADTVLLTNGDRLTGFVSAIGPVVSVEGEDGAVSEVPFDRVREVLLANPAEPQPGLLVTDDMGVTLLARALRVDSDGLVTISTAPAPLGVDSAGEDRVAYDRPGARLLGVRVRAEGSGVLAIASLEPRAVRPTGDRRWTPAPEATDPDGPVLPVGDVRMPAPGEAVYDLPPGVRAARFACAVRADAPGPWTDCVASVHAETAGGERVLLGEARVTASTSEISVAADLPDGVRAIVLRVDPGRYGAVQDSVVFAAPRLRVAD